MAFSPLPLLILASAVIVQSDDPPAGTYESAPSEIIVTGQRGEAPSEADAVETLQTFCFDPARRTGSPRSPGLESRWFPLDLGARQTFGIDDPLTPAYGLTDEARSHQLWLKIEQIGRADGFSEVRCTLLVTGGTDHRRFVGEMSRLFRGAPTQRHVGHQHGTPALPGWRQWLWTGMPQRGSSNWSSISRGREAGGQSWVVVLDAAEFYSAHDYVYGDLKTRDDGRPVSILSFGVVRKPRK